MADFLDEKRQEITRRLEELEPAVDEYRRLEAASSALDALPQSPSHTDGSRRRAVSRRPPAASATQRGGSGAAGKPRRTKQGRRKGGGSRADQARAIVIEYPGITIPELAARMGIKQNYLYRVLPTLAREGKVAKHGRGWAPLPGDPGGNPPPRDSSRKTR